MRREAPRAAETFIHLSRNPRLPTTSPYSITWDTALTTNGSHTLTAIARDAAGNTTTATSRTVTVSNSVPDTTPPAAPTGLAVQ